MLFDDTGVHIHIDKSPLDTRITLLFDVWPKQGEIYVFQSQFLPLSLHS